MVFETVIADHMIVYQGGAQGKLSAKSIDETMVLMPMVASIAACQLEHHRQIVFQTATPENLGSVTLVELLEELITGKI